jgi:hypothetical protein
VAGTETHSPGEKLSIFALAAVVLVLVVVAAFALGWFVGKILL